MQRMNKKTCGAACITLGFTCASAVAQPSTERCDSAGGPTVCVRFDNVVNAPQEDVHFRYVFADPANPSVVLLRGRDIDQTLYAWRVWSKDGAENPANIGSVSSPGGYDYEVKIANPADGPGALNAASISLDSAGDHYTLIRSGSRIAGNLTSSVFVEKNTAGTGGEADLTIDGDALGTITVPTIAPGAALSVGGDLAGTLLAEGGAAGTIEVSGSVLSTAGITVGGIDATGALSVGGDLGGALQVGSVNGPIAVNGAVLGTGSITVPVTIKTGDLTVGDVQQGAVIDIQDLSGGPGIRASLGSVDGQLILRNGISGDQEVWIAALGDNGLVDTTGGNVEGSLYIPGGGGTVQTLTALRQWPCDRF